MTIQAPQRKAPEHGTRSGYNHGCTCASCRAAHAAYVKDHRRGGVTDARVEQILQVAGKLNPEQAALVRAALPSPGNRRAVK